LVFDAIRSGLPLRSPKNAYKIKGII
jgi:hypothetical protein